MSDPDIPTRGPAKPVPYVIAGILIAIAIIMPLIVPLYAFAEPTLWGMPFFYWYQLLWVFIASGLLGIAYLIMRKEDRRRRQAVRGAGPQAATAQTSAGDGDGANGTGTDTEGDAR
ncbi:DUF3311 domain-containing protein [Humibacter ginsenosidimutans]|uniref:DUF3311 domain-containing protein n=1 Tax=Humibacter ginsenosidimutans TaxID=2599293 RepID=A0A5B8M3S1_9MICO|nr:DUF3311 domain-containing protein [Humibacter ginsenosidimutans]QDZ14425.1 DUF3311 domain-containing protein [Humibacter ginsenosidimutans]